ncbi:arginase [Sphingobacterium rhinopitheci]|uniref:arginase n=1 Tax=Sphingobacterium rhinopitheci TaxID=2781960 RepID=UPI001F529F07|nr:arginase [Sphingobacterium rhinopitheci]MCI0921781.1 arginase [Sphingobacterium rhinopitheci]
MIKPIEIIKNRSDIGAGTRGADLGIDAIEIAAINKGSDFFIRYSHKNVKTRNNSVYNPLEHRFAKLIPHIYMQCKEVASVVEHCLNNNSFPLVFSGDHSSAIGTITGVNEAYKDSKLGVIWIDAHADIHSPYTTPSGNMHGMPLAALMQLDHLQFSINEIDDETKKYWRKLKTLGGDYQKVLPEHLIYFGVRDTEKEEVSILDDLSIKNYSVEESRALGISNVVADALAKLHDCDIIYISFDVDSMDSELISKGTGTPVPKGFYPTEIKQLLEKFFESSKVVCLEIVEVNPLLDNKGNKMAEVTFDILDEVIKGM